MIDLRSDTVSQPTPAMREAIATAEVGDDVYGDDPSVRLLEECVAELLGKQDAVFVPTGTMSNQVALRVHATHGDEVLLESSAHIHQNEGGAAAALSGISLRFIKGAGGVFTADQITGAIRVNHPFAPSTLQPPTRLLCIENTHNSAGGVVWPLEAVRLATDAARSAGLRTHLDGARLWNAAAATKTPEREYAACFDTVSVCFSKGLGAPMGSALAGTRAQIDRARRFKQLFGGGFRQAGMMARGALFAIENHRERLTEDHDNARRLAEAMDSIDAIDVKLERVQSNIIRFWLKGQSAGSFVERCHTTGLHLLPTGTHSVRAVTHLGIEASHIDEAIDTIRKASDV